MSLSYFRRRRRIPLLNDSTTAATVNAEKGMEHRENKNVFRKLSKVTDQRAPKENIAGLECRMVTEHEVCPILRRIVIISNCTFPPGHNVHMKQVTPELDETSKIIQADGWGGRLSEKENEMTVSLGRGVISDLCPTVCRTENDKYG